MVCVWDKKVGGGQLTLVEINAAANSPKKSLKIIWFII
jgi:hypothetical protein